MLIIFLFLVFSPHRVSLDFHNQIVFWNVGQGQWITVSSGDICNHFDVGGEFINSMKVKQLCSQKRNSIYYSHWDWDHIGLTKELKYFSNTCIAQMPQGKPLKYKAKYLDQFQKCKKSSKVQKLQFQYLKAKTENDLSQIFIYNNKLLLTGDSTRKMEKLWSQQIKYKKLKWVSISHHGSKTSTSKEFLDNLNAELAIVSARKKVYGHPHNIVLERLKKKALPVIRTEDWGNIRIMLN